MTTRSSPNSRSTNSRSALIQWTAIGVLAVLAILAAFVFLGDDGPSTGGHSGLPAHEVSSAVSRS